MYPHRTPVGVRAPGTQAHCGGGSPMKPAHYCPLVAGWTTDSPSAWDSPCRKCSNA